MVSQIDNKNQQIDDVSGADHVPNSADIDDENKTGKRQNQNSLWAAIKSSPSALYGGIFLLIIVFACVVIPHVMKMDPFATKASDILMAPSWQHVMGADNVGRDVFARVLFGGESSLLVGGSVAVVSGVLGFIVGAYSAFFPKIGYWLMRVCDGLMAFPAILFGIALIGGLGQSIGNVILALSIVFIPYVARVVRSATMSNMNENYVSVLVSLGASSTRILWRNIALNVIAPWIIEVTFVFADAILVEAAMSFIGTGIPQPSPSWGNMLYDSRTYIYQAWWLTVFPGVALALTVFVINIFGDGLREVFDPKRRR
jgi:peptide/nickel transport system permease protein